MVVPVSVRKYAHITVSVLHLYLYSDAHYYITTYSEVSVRTRDMTRDIPTISQTGSKDGTIHGHGRAREFEKTISKLDYSSNNLSLFGHRSPKGP